MAGSAGMTTPAPRALRRFGLIAAPIAAVIDQATKAWALEALWPPYSEGITLLPVLNLRLGFNTGVTFGMFADSAAGAVWLLVGIKLAVVAWLLHWLRRSPTSSTRITAAGTGRPSTWPMSPSSAASRCWC